MCCRLALTEAVFARAGLHDIIIIWDEEEDRDGNCWHICVEGHGLSRDDVEAVLQDEESEIEVSRSSGRPTAFGWCPSGQRIAVAFEEMSENPNDCLSCDGIPGAAKEVQEEEKAMNLKHARKPKWTAADRARHRAIREEFKHCPTQEELETSGAYEGPIK